SHGLKPLGLVHVWPGPSKLRLIAALALRACRSMSAHRPTVFSPLLFSFRLVARRLWTILVGLALLTLLACSKAEPPLPAPQDEATMRTLDKKQLERIIAFDLDASRAMKEADDATHAGDAGVGATLETLDKRAGVSIEDGLRAAAGSTMKTAWG